MDEPVVLVVDNFADLAQYIVDLLENIEKKDVVVLATERSYRLRYLQTVLSGMDFKLYDRIPLTDKEVARLFDQYLHYGLLGDHGILKDRAAFSRKILTDPIAVACCRIMNDFKPLDRIVNDLLEATSSTSLDRYLVATIARLTFSGGVRYEVLTSSLNNLGLREQLKATHPMPLAYSDKAKNFVVPENSTLGDRVLHLISGTDRERLLRCFVALANAIAPRVNRTTIINRSPEARMTGRLFDYDDTIRKFLGEEADSFYAQTRDSWKWNSRYWEQVALMNLAHYYSIPNTDAGTAHLLAAIQHARHAVSIELHPFPLTTLGKVLMTQMLGEGGPKAEIFEEALMRLGKAIELETRWMRSAPQPYFSLFNGVIGYLDHGGALSSKQIETISRYMDNAETRFAKRIEINQLLVELRRKLGKFF